jgi:PAS domain-containing protein
VQHKAHSFVLTVKRVGAAQDFFVVLSLVQPLCTLSEQRPWGLSESVLNGASFLGGYIDHRQRLRYANKAWVKHCTEVAHEERRRDLAFSLQHLLPLLRRAQRTREAVQGVLSCAMRDARKETFEVWVLPGEGRGEWVLAVPITSYARLKDEAGRSLRAMDKLLKGLPLGVAFFDKTQSLKGFNYLFSSIFQLSESWLASHPSIEDILHQLRHKRILPEVLDFSAYVHRVQSFFSSSMSGTPPHEELVSLPNDRIVRVTLASYPFGGCLLTCEDVTDKLYCERKRSEADTLFNVLVKEASEGVIVVSNDLQVAFMNKTCLALWGVDGEVASCVGQPVLQLFTRFRGCLYYRHLFSDYQQRMMSVMEARRPETHTILMAEGTLLRVAYSPLATGEHLWRCTDLTAAQACFEVAREAERLSAIEGHVMQTRCERLKKKVEARVSAVSAAQEAVSGPETSLLLSRDAGREDERKGGLSPAFFDEVLRDWQGTWSEARALKREKVFLAEVLDEVLLALDGLIAKKELYVQMLGSFSLHFILDRGFCVQLLSSTIGAVLHEARTCGVVTLSLRQARGGLVLTVSSPTPEDRMAGWQEGEQHFRAWHLGTTLLSQLSEKGGCSVRSMSYRASHFSLACVFPLSVVERNADAQVSAHLLAIPQRRESS